MCQLICIEYVCIRAWGAATEGADRPNAAQMPGGAALHCSAGRTQGSRTRGPLYNCSTGRRLLPCSAIDLTLSLFMFTDIHLILFLS